MRGISPQFSRVAAFPLSTTAMCGLAFIGPRICFTSLLTRGSSPLSISVLKRKTRLADIVGDCGEIIRPGVDRADSQRVRKRSVPIQCIARGRRLRAARRKSLLALRPPASSSAVGIVSLKAMSSVNLSFFGVIEIYDSSPRTSAPLMSKRRFSLASGRPTLHTRVPSLFFRKTKPHSSL